MFSEGFGLVRYIFLKYPGKLQIYTYVCVIEHLTQPYELSSLIIIPNILIEPRDI